MSFYKFIILACFICLLVYTCAGQCCSAGSPLGGDGCYDGLNKNDIRIFASYKNSLSKDYYHFEKKYNIPYVQKSYFDYGNLSLTYGLFSRFSLHTEVGYFIDKAQELNINNENEVIKAKGLGDLAFNIRYVAIETIKPISQLVFSAGMKAPIGSFKEEINGITIPVSLQPSSGAFKYNASAFYYRKRSDRKLGWNGFAHYEISQTIEQGYLIYRYGDYFQFTLGGLFTINKNFIFTANAKLEWRGKDTRESGIKIESTGSRVIYFNPQLMYSFKSKWAIILMSDIPVYKYVNGYQLTNRFSFQTGLRRNVSFCKSEK